MDQTENRLYCDQLDADIRWKANAKLPAACASRSAVDGSPFLIKLGESGYFPLHHATDVERFNSERGITAAQLEAMEMGSMFGWNIPAADPDNY